MISKCDLRHSLTLHVNLSSEDILNIFKKNYPYVYILLYQFNNTSEAIL